MIKVIEKLIWEFRSCFSRQAAFYWFLIIIMGFIVRFDHLGVTSFVRWLFLRPECYELILHFFRSTAWNLDCLLQYWAAMAVNHYPLIKFNDRPLLIGDGTKVSKEAKKMPAVKWLHQDSENSGKAQYINGHHFGFVGLLVGSLAKAFCLPLHGQLHEGTDGLLRPGKEFAGKPATIVTRMAYLVLVTAKHLGCLCYVTLDAYFATGPAFLILKTAVNEKGEQWVHLITRAKDNYVAYYDCADAKKRFQQENKIQLMSLFNSPEHFQKVELMIYGQLKTVEYYCANLFWKPVNDRIRFVLVRDQDRCYILMCSDLNLCPTQIITVYSYRWKIEVMFLMLKQFIGGFCYHFWTKAFPLLERSERIDYCKLSDSDRKKLDRTVEAIERFVNLASIALGLLQYLALTYASEIWKHYHGWLRTYSSEIPSERIVQSVIQTEFFSSLGKVPVCRTLRLILERSRPPPLDWAA
jgi:hypothetical protein